jgi:hypothetical protein
MINPKCAHALSFNTERTGAVAKILIICVYKLFFKDNTSKESSVSDVTHVQWIFNFIIKYYED